MDNAPTAFATVGTVDSADVRIVHRRNGQPLRVVNLVDGIEDAAVSSFFAGALDGIDTAGVEVFYNGASTWAVEARIARFRELLAPDPTPRS